MGEVGWYRVNSGRTGSLRGNLGRGDGHAERSARGHVEFHLLGPLDVWADGVPLLVGAPRQRALLAALLLHPNQVVPVNRLIDMVWGEPAPRSAIANLRSYVAALRRQLAPADAGESRLIAR